MSNEPNDLVLVILRGVPNLIDIRSNGNVELVGCGLEGPEYLTNQCLGKPKAIHRALSMATA